VAKHIPRDQLPRLGDWSGPMFGELGVLEIGDDGVRCHICGRWFNYLSAHLLRKHGVHPEEYRALFGLRATTRLMSPALRQLFRERHIDVLSRYWDGRGFDSLTPEQRSEFGRGRTWRLQAKQDPRNIEVHRRTIRQAQAGVARARGEGKRWWRDAREIAPLGRERFKELVADPEWKAQWAAKIAASKGGRKAIDCIVCGTAFVSLTGRRTCSDACEHESRSQRPSVATRPDVRERMSAAARRRGRDDLEALRNLPQAAFEHLADVDRRATLGYFGLAGEPLRTQRQLAAELGLSSSTVGQHIRRTVACLLRPEETAATR